jgi:Tfp pilus assembly PilM family ATPase
MVSVRRGWIGVDFGASAIKLAQLERDGRGLRLVAAAVLQREFAQSAPTDSRPLEGTTRDWNPASLPAWSAHEIRAALDLEPRFRGRLAACVLSAVQAGVRMLELPPGSDAELRSMIGHHLQETLGADAVDCEFDHWDGSAPEVEAETNSIGVVYAPRRVAVEAARNCSAAGLNCEALDGLPLALARAMEIAGTPPDEKIAVVDWGHARVSFAVVVGGRPLFVRRLRDCSFGELVRSIAAELTLPRHDVEQLLTLYGVHAEGAESDDEAEMARLLARLGGREILALEQELVRTFDHLRLHRPGLLPERIVLCGGGATIAGIAAELTRRLDQPIELWRLPRTEGESPRVPPGLEPLLAPAVALSALAWTA